MVGWKFGVTPFSLQLALDGKIEWVRGGVQNTTSG